MPVLANGVCGQDGIENCLTSRSPMHGTDTNISHLNSCIEYGWIGFFA